MGCGGTFDVEACGRDVQELESRMAAPGFWDRADEAQKTVARLKIAKKTLDEFGRPDTNSKSLTELLELAEQEADPSMLEEIERELGTLEQQVAALETKSLLSGEH